MLEALPGVSATATGYLADGHFFDAVDLSLGSGGVREAVEGEDLFEGLERGGIVRKRQRVEAQVRDESPAAGAAERRVAAGSGLEEAVNVRDWTRLLGLETRVLG